MKTAKLPARLKPQARPLFRGTEPSLWDFWKDGVSSSFLHSYLSCKEQTRLSYVQGWSSRHTPLAFEFGTCIHWALEMMYGRLQFFRELAEGLHGKKNEARFPLDSLVNESKLLVAKYETKWLKETPNPSDKQLQQQELVYGMAEAVLPHYMRRWAGDFTGEYKFHNTTVAPRRWHSLEEIFTLPYEYPDGKKTVLRGKRDGVFIDRFNKYWVFDTKCRSVINHEEALDTLPSDVQQMLYLYVTMLELGKAPSGVVMNIVRRPGHRRGKDETLKTFLGRIAKDVATEARYDHYFVRYEMIVTKAEIMQWKERVLDPVMQEVRLWWEGKIPHYMNPNALVSKYGRCSLFLPIVKGEYGQCYKRKHAFNELADAA